MAELPQIELPARHPHRHAPRQPQRPPNAVAEQDGGCHHARDARQQARPGRHDRPHAQGRAEQHDRDLQQGLGAEGHASMPALARGPGRSDRGADQDGQHQRLQPGPAEHGLLPGLQRHGGQGDGAAQQQAGQHACRAAGQPPEHRQFARCSGWDLIGWSSEVRHERSGLRPDGCNVAGGDLFYQQGIKLASIENGDW